MYKLSKRELRYRAQHRGRYYAEPHWYALFVHFGQEAHVARKLRRCFDTQHVPDILLPQVEPPPTADWLEPAAPPSGRLLFSGYVFIRCRMSDPIYLRLCEQPAVYEVLGHAFRIPAVIPDAEMALFRAALACSPHIQPRTATPPASACNPVGQTVRVTRGLLRGASGHVLSCSARHLRLQVQFSFLGRDSCLVVTVLRQDVALRAAQGASESTTRLTIDEYEEVS
jgi:transcription antitermination factor NusG